MNGKNCWNNYLVTSSETRPIGVIEMDDRASCPAQLAPRSNTLPTPLQNYYAAQNRRFLLPLTESSLRIQSGESIL